MSLYRDTLRWKNAAPLFPVIPPQPIDLGFVLGKIREQKAATRRRWAQPSKFDFIRRQAKRMVIGQWMAEAPNAS